MLVLGAYLRAYLIGVFMGVVRVESGKDILVTWLDFVYGVFEWWFEKRGSSVV